MALAVSGGSDPRTVSFRLEGEHVTVTRGAEYRRVWRDLIAIEEDARGGRKVIAVGDTFEELAREASPEQRRALAGVRFSRALYPADFDPEIAWAFVNYAAYCARPRTGWRSVLKPRLLIEIPGLEHVGRARQLAFEHRVRGLGHPTLVNGIRSRPLSRWLERISTLLVAVPVALVLAVAGGAHRWSPAVSKALLVVLGVWVVLALAWSFVEPRWRARILAGTGADSVQRRH